MTDQQHLDLIHNVREMIAHAGDNSNLILDPELDSYYLMDVTLMALPQTQDRLTQVMVDGVKRLQALDAADHERVTLAIDLAMLREDSSRIHESIKTTLNNGNPAYGVNESVPRRLPPLLAKYSQANERFCQMLTKLQSMDSVSISQAEFLAAGQAVREATFEFWTASVEELDGLLQKRIHHYTYRRTFSLGISACALMAAACFVTFITRSISGPLKKQAAELKASLLETEAERKIAMERLVLQQKAESELRAAQDQLVSASRQAGMAEVATGVLHNVGNVLTSVNVSVHQIKDTVQASPVNKLTRAAEMIDAHESDLGSYLTADPRGKFIPGYVSELAKMLGQENAAMLAEIENLARGVEHIKQVVQFQQNYAKPSTVFEIMNPAELLEDALRLNLIALDRHGVTIERDVADIGPVKIDKHKTLQILVNLISNAKNAMCDLNGNKERRLALRVHAIETDAGRRLRISVQDNGMGIAPENLSRIFAHGFTTRKDGHGFGLHSAANSAREMGGTLEVDSAGPGQGATFTLEIPLQMNEVMA
ncbi:MAG: ATP-binding protein [Tepidisphaeraceae bacterium]